MPPLGSLLPRDWHSTALELHRAGRNISEIARACGVARASVGSLFVHHGLLKPRHEKAAQVGDTLPDGTRVPCRERACLGCRKRFMQTARLRVLCPTCFHGGG